MTPHPSRPQPPRRGAYLLPSFFTMANVFCGYYALTETLHAGQAFGTDLAAAALHFDTAARAIGFAILFDGLDGRIARLMGTSSSFGKELDSLADTITFGIAPAFLALAWGVRAVLPPSPEASGIGHLNGAGWVISFLFVICGAARLARFNIQTGVATATIGRSEHKYFIGLPIPAAAGLVAAIVHASSGQPIEDWLWVPFWLLLLVATALLMVSTWRYYSFKELDLRRKRPFVVVVVVGIIFGLIWFYSHAVLLLIASTYVLSGIVAKLAHAFRWNRREFRADKQNVTASPHR